MKKAILFSCLTFNLLFAYSQVGVIYNFEFKVDNELVTQMKVQNKDYKILNIATVEELPKELSDTIAIISEQLIGTYLNAEITSLMQEEKLVMGALPEHLLYLPANFFKKAIKIAPDKNLYIDISCYISANGGAQITLLPSRYSKVKPKLTLKIKVYDMEKNLLETKEAVLKDFENLRSRTFEDSYGIKGLKQNTDVVTISETIDDNDVLKMYVLGLIEALK
jgi:hypothetical protein